ncbi:endo-1,4-beta-xylanase B-like [Perca flavescens]|uniref:endo-1,4-beta-xylanase B-like n=1 Tax=Perca flavescens TaxID=8167 RepID=UPI00106E9718|nr:endo-1,4-beta-xylanase B-like [Perca flavescens]
MPPTPGGGQVLSLTDDTGYWLATFNKLSETGQVSATATGWLFINQKTQGNLQFQASPPAHPPTFNPVGGSTPANMPPTPGGGQGLGPTADTGYWLMALKTFTGPGQVSTSATGWLFIDQDSRGNPQMQPSPPALPPTTVPGSGSTPASIQYGVSGQALGLADDTGYWLVTLNKLSETGQVSYTSTGWLYLDQETQGNLHFHASPPTHPPNFNPGFSMPPMPGGDQVSENRQPEWGTYVSFPEFGFPQIVSASEMPGDQLPPPTYITRSKNSYTRVQQVFSRSTYIPLNVPASALYHVPHGTQPVTVPAGGQPTHGPGGTQPVTVPGGGGTQPGTVPGGGQPTYGQGGTQPGGQGGTQPGGQGGTQPGGQPTYGQGGTQPGGQGGTQPGGQGGTQPGGQGGTQPGGQGGTQPGGQGGTQPGGQGGTQPGGQGGTQPGGQGGTQPGGQPTYGQGGTQPGGQGGTQPGGQGGTQPGGQPTYGQGGTQPGGQGGTQPGGQPTYGQGGTQPGGQGGTQPGGQPTYGQGGTQPGGQGGTQPGGQPTYGQGGTQPGGQPTYGQGGTQPGGQGGLNQEDSPPMDKEDSPQPWDSPPMDKAGLNQEDKAGLNQEDSPPMDKDSTRRTRGTQPGGQPTYGQGGTQPGGQGGTQPGGQPTYGQGGLNQEDSPPMDKAGLNQEGSPPMDKVGLNQEDKASTRGQPSYGQGTQPGGQGLN